MRVLKVVGLICITILAVTCLLWWGCGPHKPSDESLERQFYKQQPELERLVAMMDEDSQMTRITADYILREGNIRWPRSESEWGISRKRWDEYREIFYRAGVEDGIRQDGPDIVVEVWSWGIIPAGSSIGYLYCRQTPVGHSTRESACSEKRNSGTGMYGNSTSWGYRYKKITEDWYILEEEW